MYCREGICTLEEYLKLELSTDEIRYMFYEGIEIINKREKTEL